MNNLFIPQQHSSVLLPSIVNIFDVPAPAPQPPSEYDQLVVYLNNTDENIDFQSDVVFDPILSPSFQPFQPSSKPHSVAQNTMQVHDPQLYVLPDPLNTTEKKKAKRYEGWRCPECYKDLRNMNALTSHFKTQHSAISMDRSKVIRVLRTDESDYGPTDCVRCEKKCSSLRSLRQHFCSRKHIETLIADQEVPKDAILLFEMSETKQKDISWRREVDKTDFNTVKKSIIDLVAKARSKSAEQASSSNTIPLQAGQSTDF